MGSLVWTPQNCTRVPSRPGFSQLWSSQWDSTCLDPEMCLSPPSCKVTALRKWDSILGNTWGSSAPQNSTFLGIKGLQRSAETCLEKSILRKLKQEWSWQAGSWDSPLRVCFRMRASYFLQGWPLCANFCISSTKMAASDAGGFRPSSKEAVAARVLHHSHEPSGKDSLPSGGLCASDTGSCRLLQGLPQLGAVVTLLFSWLPIKDLARPPRAWPFPAIPGLFRALCWVCANAQWCPCPSCSFPLALRQSPPTHLFIPTPVFLYLSTSSQTTQPARGLLSIPRADWLDPKESWAKENKQSYIWLTL